MMRSTGSGVGSQRGVITSEAPFRASLLKRFFACCIDATAIMVLLRIVMDLLEDLPVLPLADALPVDIREPVGSIILYTAYAALCFAFFDTSLGKRLLALRIVQRTTGEPVRLARFLWRESIGRVLSGFLLVGYIIAFIRKDRLALHDLIFDTAVVKGSLET